SLVKEIFAPPSNPEKSPHGKKQRDLRETFFSEKGVRYNPAILWRCFVGLLGFAKESEDASNATVTPQECNSSESKSNSLYGWIGKRVSGQYFCADRLADYYGDWY